MTGGKGPYMSRLVLARRTRQGHVAEGSDIPWDSKAEAIFTRQFSVKCSETKLQWHRNCPSASDLYLSLWKILEFAPAASSRMRA